MTVNVRMTVRFLGIFIEFKFFIQVPPGLTLCQRELAQIAGNFVRLVNYNRAVFGEFYSEIIENHVLFKRDDQKSEA